MSITVGDNSRSARPTMTSDTIIIVAAHNEADRIAATLAALRLSLPGAAQWVADDGSCDETAEIAQACGARVVRCNRVIGKGGAMTLAAREALRGMAESRLVGAPEAIGPRAGDPPALDPVVVLCDGDLADSAASLGPLAQAIASGEGDLAVAVFAKRVGGGFGLALGFARRAIRRRCGLECKAPISGQRAMRASTLAHVLPFADGFGMEVGMTIDAARAGRRVVEVEIDLAHRATGRTLGGFVHRARQLLDIARAERARR